MAYSYSDLTTDIRNYTEVDSNVLTAAVINGFLRNAENRINLDCPMDSDRVQAEAQFATDFNTITMPTGTLFVRGIEVYNSTTSVTGPAQWLEKRDQTFISEYVGQLTGPEGGSAAQDTTGLPKYYAMFGGATTGTSTATSGAIYVAPTPDANYKYIIHYNALPTGLETNTSGTYVSNYFPQGLLYACLNEAYAFLKGPADMLTLYENKYKQELQKFAAMQIGRRRRDDYTDGTVRIPIESANQ
jgi:hypothetical protein|tara:strand:+ start:1108 stop:1839 length:732 start_codon:yes stop_codon:yes gene_type:complete